MAEFYGTLQGNRGPTTRIGTKKSGITTIAACWEGAIEVYVYNDANGDACYNVYSVGWYGRGLSKQLAQGRFKDVK